MILKTPVSQYWEKIEEVTSEIKNPDIYHREKEKNKKLKEEWDKNYKKADEQVKRAFQLHSDAEDAHKVLMLMTMRQTIGEKINKLQDISNEAATVFQEIQEVTQKGQAIIRKQDSKS